MCKSNLMGESIVVIFEGCDKYYHPMFSNPFKGEYAEKWCDENNNILRD